MKQRSQLDQATVHEVKVAALCWAMVAGMCVALANAFAASYL